MKSGDLKISSKPARILLLLLVVVMLAGSALLAMLAFHERAQRSESSGFYARLAPAAHSDARGETLQETEEGAPRFRATSRLDFDALWETCPDIVGWISIDGTVVDYPIVQGADNDFYLSHLADGTENPSGAIMMTCTNAPDFSDPVTILHGHNIMDGTMFGDLDLYRMEYYYQEHPVIHLYTPDGDYAVEIFAAYVVDAMTFEYPTFFPDRDAFDTFLRKAVSSTRYETEVEVNYGDRILMLSTCNYTFWNARYIILGKIPPAVSGEAGK